MTLPENVTLQKCDVTDPESVEAFFADSKPVDILISSATGGDRALGPFLSMNLDGCVRARARRWQPTSHNQGHTVQQPVAPPIFPALVTPNSPTCLSSPTIKRRARRPVMSDK